MLMVQFDATVEGIDLILKYGPAVFIKDTKGVYMMCSDAFTALVGLNKPQAIIGLTDSNLSWQISAHHAAIFQADDTAVMRSGITIRKLEKLGVKGKEAQHFWLEKKPLYKNRHCIGVMGILTPVSKEMKYAFARRQGFFAEFSPAVRNNLNLHPINVNLCAQVIAEDIAKLNAFCETNHTLLVHECQPTLARLANRATELKQSSEMVYKVARQIIKRMEREQNPQQISCESFDMVKLLNDARARAKKLIGNKQLSIHFSQQSCNTYLASDAYRIETILEQLIDNAIAFTSSGAIYVAAKLDTGQDNILRLQLSVKDTGIGISQENQGIVFAPMTRLDKTFSNEDVRLGNGLATVSEMVEELHGNIALESAPGEGSTFTVTIPVAQVNNLERQKPNASEKQQLVSFVLVEDSMIVRHIMNNFITEKGYQVLQAENRAGALNHFNSDTRQIYLMDINLGPNEPTGIDITREIRELEEKQGIHKEYQSIILGYSAHMNEEVKQQCLKSGMQAAFEKGNELNPLWQQICRYIEPREMKSDGDCNKC